MKVFSASSAIMSFMIFAVPATSIHAADCDDGYKKVFCPALADIRTKNIILGTTIQGYRVIIPQKSVMTPKIYNSLVCIRINDSTSTLSCRFQTKVNKKSIERTTGSFIKEINGVCQYSMPSVFFCVK